MDRLFGEDEGAAARGRTAVPASAQPLAARMRPVKLDEFVGQEHLLERGIGAARRARGGPPAFDGPLRAARHRQDDARAADRACSAKAAFEEISAVNAGREEVREVLARAEERRAGGGEGDAPLPRRDPSLQQGAAGRAAAGGRGGIRLRWSARRPRTPSSRSTRRCCRAVACTSCARSRRATSRAAAAGAGGRRARIAEPPEVGRRGAGVPGGACGRRRPDGAGGAGAGGETGGRGRGRSRSRAPRTRCSAEPSSTTRTATATTT